MNEKDLAWLRKKAGLTIKEVVICLDVADSTVRNWEKGRSVPKLSPSEYVKILELYSCTPKEFESATLLTRKLKIDIVD